MFFLVLFFIFITLGGLAITYLYDDDAPFAVRLAAGVVIGNAAVGAVGFLLACLFGLNPLSVAVAAGIICAAPILLVGAGNFYRRMQIDLTALELHRRRFLARLNPSRLFVIGAYSGLLLMLWFFFERAMLSVRGGIGTGSTHNIGDLPFHLLVINGFVAGQNFPPQNPVYAGVTFTYPYMTDLVAAMINTIGASISEAMFWQNILLAVALVVLLWRFTFKLTGNATAALVAPFLLLFDGGFGFLLFFRDAAVSQLGIIGQLFNLSLDYTIRGEGGWRWGNSLTTLFLTQRAFLLGLPLALIVLIKVWEIFTKDTASQEDLIGQNETENKPQSSARRSLKSYPLNSYLPIFIVGLLAGMLPLIHAHTFAVVMGMTALIAAMSLGRWREWTTFFVAAGLIAVPELLTATLGSAATANSFLGWEFGWDHGAANPIWFWFKNTGLFIPLLAAAIGCLLTIVFRNTNAADNSADNSDEEPASAFLSGRRARSLLLFYAPFLLCFIIPNMVRLAPWVWDNVKVLIYWFVASIPLVALLLAYLWERSRVTKYAAVVLLVTLTFSGWLDVWRVASRQYEYQIISPEMMQVAAQVRERTKPHEIMLGAPDYSNLPVLTGRRWFLGWTAHVWSHGIAGGERENVIKQIYAGGDTAKTLIRENNIRYIIVGPLERKYTLVNEEYFKTFPIIAAAGEYRVYQVN